MKKILTIAIVVASALAFTACTDSDLDSENYTGANTGNFPTNVNDLNKEIAALYGVMNQISTNPLTNPFFYNVIMGDEVNGAGGDGDTESHAVGHMMATTQDYYADTYKCIYVGIARATSIIYTDESILSKLDETKKNQLLGEAYFMRGLLYFWAVQTWGDVPAYWTISAPDPCPQVSAKDLIMPHVIEDFKTAYDLMSFDATTQGDGHASKGAAAGYLARAYMFYEGFYNNVSDVSNISDDIVGVDEDNFSINKAAVVQCLEETFASGKYSLVSDFRELWQYTNQYTTQGDAAKFATLSNKAEDLNRLIYDPTTPADSVASYTAQLTDIYTKEMVLGRFLDTVKKADGSYCSWAGNGNSEEMFGIQYGNMASWNGTIGMGFTNQIELYCGLRCDDAADGEKDPLTGNVYHNGTTATYPYGQGWGQATINANAYEAWPDNDPRKQASVANVVDECYHYSYTTSCTEDAGLYNKKLIAITEVDIAGNDMTAGPYTWWDIVRTSDSSYGDCSNGNCMQGSHYSDVVLMRYADLLLMHSELTGGQTISALGDTGINLVRLRAGLNRITYTLDNLKSERRWEFFGEGIRFNDLRRWTGITDSSNKNCLAAQALQKQDGARVNYQGRETTMHHATSSWAQRYAETYGFLPIPSSQINVVNDASILKQNAGWGDDVSDWNMTSSPVY